MRRVLGTAHNSPGWQSCGGRKIRPPAKNNARTAPAIKNVREGASSVRFPLQPPLKPRATKTRGARQQVEAKMAATPPTRRAPEPVRSEPLTPISTLTWHPPASVGFLLSKLGNERDVYAALYCYFVRPIAARAPACEGR